MAPVTKRNLSSFGLSSAQADEILNSIEDCTDEADAEDILSYFIEAAEGQWTIEQFTNVDNETIVIYAAGNALRTLLYSVDNNSFFVDNAQSYKENNPELFE